MDKNCVFGQQKIDLLLKLHFLHFLAKFKQKIPKKSKNMAEKAVFGPKKGHFRTQKMTKIVFSLKLHFLHFLSKFRQKKAKNYKNTKKNLPETKIYLLFFKRLCHKNHIF